MKWFKYNRVKILVVLLHSFLLARLLLGAYEVNLITPLILVAPVLKIAVPTALIGIGLVGLIRDVKPIYILLALVGGVLLWQSFQYDPEGILDAVRLINDKLTSGRELLFEDFSFIMDNMTLIVVAVSFLTIYVYPWNLLIIDLSLIFFLWAVDSLPQPDSLLVPLVLLWGFLFVHDRIMARDSDYGSYRVNQIDQGSRLRQGLVLSLLIGAITINLVGQGKGPLYNDIWMKANNYLMQEDALPGDYFADSFSLKVTGYQDSSTSLGGNVSLNNNIAFRLAGKAPLYMRGNTKQVYTGSIWERSKLIYRTNNTASELITKAYEDAPVHEVTVDPAGVETSSLFVPSYPKSVTLERRNRDQRTYYSIQDQTFMVAEPQRDNYTVSFYDQAYVEQLALEGINDGVTQEHSDYLQLPETITDRTVDLVNNIIEGKETKADKILALTTFLRDNYDYNLTPGPIPADQDFVDYFLFEVQEGYCIYYASALTIMLRIAGIPARYAEGFKVSDETDSSGNYLVRNQDAHAWTEVLTDPRKDLWTIWDATGTPREQETLGNENGGFTPSTPLEPRPELTRPLEPTPEDTLPDGSPAPSEKPTTEGGDFDLEIPSWVWSLLVATLALAGVLLFKRKRVNRLIEEDSAKPYLKYIIRLLKESGVDVKDSNTLEEISQQVMDANLKKEFQDFAANYYEATYGKRPASLNSEQKTHLLEEAYRVHRINNNGFYHLLRKFVW